MSVYKRILDINCQFNLTKNYNLKLTLKKDPIKGICVFVVKPIKLNEIIAYYKLRVFDARTYESQTNNIYTFSVFSKNRISKNLVADITPDSFPLPIKNIPFWACFVNEPSMHQKINAIFDPNIQENSKKSEKNRIHVGDTVIYNIRAIKDIEPGTEITTYYGDEYDRDYEIDISEEDKKKCCF